MYSARTKLDGIQSLRGIAAFVVAVFHFSRLEQAFFGPDLIFSDFSQYGRAGVDLFFVISGYIMVLVAGTAAPGAQSATDFLIKRAVRIYPPYWLVTCFVILVWWLSNGSLFGVLMGKDPNWIASFALWPHDRYPILLVGWTLVHEMYFYLVFAALLLLPIAWRSQLFVLWALIVLATALPALEPSSAVSKIVFSPLTLEFLLGCAVALIRPRVQGLFWPALGCAVIWVVATSTLLDFAPTHEQFERYWPRLIVFGPASALLVFAVTDPARQIAWPKPLVALGDASYAFYLLHAPIFMLLRLAWDRFSAPGIFDNAFALVLMMSVAIALSFPFYRFVEQPSLRLGSRVTRSRAQ